MTPERDLLQLTWEEGLGIHGPWTLAWLERSREEGLMKQWRRGPRGDVGMDLGKWGRWGIAVGVLGTSGRWI